MGGVRSISTISVVLLPGEEHMECPFCKGETHVLESRFVEDSVRRRRECLKCQNRFTTYEQPYFQLTVIKKDGRQQPFEAEKITRSIERACGKAEAESVQQMSQCIERKLLAKKKKTLTTKEIGRLVLQELRKFDKMAYLRFATIHKSMEDPQELRKEVKMLR